VVDRRSHRGPHPEDHRLFAPEAVAVLCRAGTDLCWLLSRGYPQKSALKLVGDRYELVARQRIAVGRTACGNAASAARQARLVGPHELAGRPLGIDGYNVLTTIEAALAGGVILHARDGTFRDMASMHGSFRKVEETLPALELLGKVTTALDPCECIWYLDRPVSNSGRLRGIMEDLAAARGWRWQIRLVPDPDVTLSDPQGAVVVTADSAILDRCGPWLNLARQTVAQHIPQAWVVGLGGESADWTA